MPTSPLTLAMLGSDSGNGAGAMDPSMLAAMPRLNLAQSLMQNATDSSSAYPLQALARVVGGFAGNHLFDKAIQGIQASTGGNAQAMSDTLPDGHPLKAALMSPNPNVRYQAMQVYPKAMALMSAPEKLSAGETNTVGGAQIGGNNGPQSPLGKILQDAANAGNPDAIALLKSQAAKEATNNGVALGVGGQPAPKILASSIPGYGAAEGANTGAAAATAAPGEAANAGAVTTAKANAQNASDLNYKPLTAGAVANQELGPKILGNIASEGMIPRVTTPTEALTSPFAALPPEAQTAIKDAINKAHSYLNPPAPQGGATPITDATFGPGPNAQGSAPQPPQPQSAAQPQQPGVIPAKMTPQQASAETKLGEEFGDADRKKFEAASQTLGGLSLMNNSIENLNQKGWSSTGVGNPEVMGFAKAINGVGQKVGITDPLFDPTKIATWEQLVKESRRAGFQLASSLGSREAASVIQSAISAVPNAENTYVGARLVSSGIEQMLQRERDLYSYKAAQLSAGKPLASAEADFNKANPVQTYTMRAVANAVPDSAVTKLQANPDKVTDFDKMTGQGVGEFILNGGRTGMININQAAQPPQPSGAP